jgi:hypothetical protein
MSPMINSLLSLQGRVFQTALTLSFSVLPALSTSGSCSFFDIWLTVTLYSLRNGIQAATALFTSRYVTTSSCDIYILIFDYWLRILMWIPFDIHVGTQIHVQMSTDAQQEGKFFDGHWWWSPRSGPQIWVATSRSECVKGKFKTLPTYLLTYLSLT